MSAKKPPKGALPRKVRKEKKGIKGAWQRNWQPVYTAILAETGVYDWACKKAGVTFVTVWRERQRNPEFAAAEAESLKAAALLYEGETIRRAVHGLRQYKFTAAGQPVMDPRTGEQYYELEYSDSLLQMVLKGRMPEVYRDKQDVTVGGTVGHTHLTLAQWDERMKLANA